MKINAYAKINIGLDVLRKRHDGYHEVRMIMQSIELHDEIEIEKTDRKGTFVFSDRKDIPLNDDNLVCKAAKLMTDEFALDGGFNIDLKKNIPVAAGLAGGSTDAAAVLKAINEIHSLGLDVSELMKLGVKIGADVPYCIMGGTALAEGIGEILTALDPMPRCRLLVAKPPVDVSTSYVYSHLEIDKISHPNIDIMIKGIKEGNIETVFENMGNVLESVTEKEIPVISRLKSVMRNNGAKAAMMSGSGPTVFGFFDDPGDIKKAYDVIRDSDFAGEVFITGTYDQGTQEL